MRPQPTDAEAEAEREAWTDAEGSEPLTSVTAVPEPAALTRRVRRGALWAVAANIVMRFASVGVTAVLARLLSQEDFGVFAVALAVYLVVASLAELGMASAVARSAREPDEIAPTIASISILVSVVTGGPLAAFAPVLASLLGQPAAASSIQVLAICVALTGVFAVPGAQLVRDFRQDRIFLGTIIGFVVSNPLLVVLALNGAGATAFAWSRVVGQIATGLVFVLSTSRHYWPGWRRDVVMPLLRFGVPLSLANLVNWTLLNADYMILGRFVGAAEVGVYMIAFTVAGWSTAVLGSVLNSVVVPAFGRVSESAERVTAALRTSSELVALIALPIGALTMTLSDPLIRTVFGERWAEAVPVLAVLSLYGVLYAFSLLYANVLVAMGATTRLLFVQLAWVAVLVPGMVLGLRWDGLVGAAWAHVVTISAIAVPGYALMVLRTTGERRPAVLVTPALRPLAGAVASGLAAWLTSSLVEPPVLRLLLGGVVGGCVYLMVTAPIIVRLLPARLVPSWNAARVTRRPTHSGPAAVSVGQDTVDQNAASSSAQSPAVRPLRIVVGLEGLALGGCPINALDLARTLRTRGHHVSVFAVDEHVKVSLLPYAAAAGFEVARLSSGTGIVPLSRSIAQQTAGADVVHVFAPWLAPAARVAAVTTPGQAVVSTNWTMSNVPYVPRDVPQILGTAGLQHEAQLTHPSHVWLMEPPVDLIRDTPDVELGSSFRRQWGIADHEVAVVVVSRVDSVMKAESMRYAIRALTVLEDPRWRLVVVGDGDAFDDIAVEARRTNALLGRPAVVLMGAMDDPRPAYSAADVTLGMGGSALRCLAHAKPLIVLGVNGFACTFTRASAARFYETGFYGEEPCDEPVDHLAAELRPLLEPLARRDLGAYGRSAVEQRFSLETAAAALEAVYAEALADRPGPLRRPLWGAAVLARHLAHQTKSALSERVRRRAQSSRGAGLGGHLDPNGVQPDVQQHVHRRSDRPQSGR